MNHRAPKGRLQQRDVAANVGTLDEPGLSWGKTPAGGMASGFPNWDEQEWYESRGWKYTNDPASRSDADWMKYMAVRCAILRENNAQASKDLKTVWPGMAFSTDLYAPHAIMDGTDPLNQQVNDFPSSHVFVDWGIDRLGAYSGVMLEKAHDPTSKLAHAMNGQLFGKTVPQPGQRHAYRVCLNGMLAAGLASNWWLNSGGMNKEDLAAVNTPAKRLGPVLREMSPSGHDAAVLWSFTESAMRQKDMAAKEASYYQTNHFMDEPVRQAVLPFKAAMRQTASIARLETQSNELVVERHVGGEGQLYMVINGYEELPKIADSDSYHIYNYAPQQATYTLRGLPKQCVVYVIEGGDWSRIGKQGNPHAPLPASFEPGEMKLCLVAPRDPAGLDLAASAAGGVFSVMGSLKGLKMPWPLCVTVKGPAGKTLYQVYRATGADGRYQEHFPIGANAGAGAYTVTVSSPAGNLSAHAQVSCQAAPPAPQVVQEQVTVFDAPTIRSFLAGKPEVVIAVGNDAHRGAAEKLAAGLTARGIRVTVRSEGQVLRKVRYPRVWNPYAKVYHAGGPEQPLAGRKVDKQIALATAADGAVTAKTSDAKDLAAHDWRQPNSLVTIDGDGYVDWSGDAEVCYEPGVKLHLDAQRRVTVLKGQATEEKTTGQFKARWSKPWTHLTSHVGAYQLPPQLPEAYTADSHLILLGDSTTSQAVAALQASDLLLEAADSAYPGPGKALLSFAWSPFAVEKNAVLIGASDEAGLAAGVAKLLELAR